MADKGHRSAAIGMRWHIVDVARQAHRRFMMLHAALAIRTVDAIDGRLPDPLKEPAKQTLRYARDLLVLPARIIARLIRTGHHWSRRVGRFMTLLGRLAETVRYGTRKGTFLRATDLSGGLQYMAFEASLDRLRKDRAFPLSLLYDPLRQELIAVCDVGAPPQNGSISKQAFLERLGNRPPSRVVVRYRDRWDLLPCPFEFHRKPKGEAYLEFEMPAATPRALTTPSFLINDLFGAGARPIAFCVLSGEDDSPQEGQ